MKNIVILISGRGSNMQAIVNATIPDARIAAVLSNSATAAGLAWAAERGISTDSINDGVFASTIQAGMPADGEIDDLDDDAIERSIAEINEAIQRTKKSPP